MIQHVFTHLEFTLLASQLGFHFLLFCCHEFPIIRSLPKIGNCSVALIPGPHLENEVKTVNKCVFVYSKFINDFKGIFYIILL